MCIKYKRSMLPLPRAASPRLILAAACVLVGRQVWLQTFDEARAADFTYVDLPAKTWTCKTGPSNLLVIWPKRAALQGGERFPLISFAHGMGVGPDFYFAALSTLANEGFVVVAPNRGQTGRLFFDPEFCTDEWEDQGRAVDEAYLRRRQFPFTAIDFRVPVSLVGHSMGGWATLRSAAAAQRRLATTNGAPVTYGAAVSFAPSPGTNSCGPDAMRGMEALSLAWERHGSPTGSASAPPKRTPKEVLKCGRDAVPAAHLRVPTLLVTSTMDFSPDFVYFQYRAASTLKLPMAFAYLNELDHDGPAQSVQFAAVTAAWILCRLGLDADRCPMVDAPMEAARSYLGRDGQSVGAAPPLSLWCPDCDAAVQSIHGACLSRTVEQCEAWQRAHEEGDRFQRLLTNASVSEAQYWQMLETIKPVAYGP